MPWQMPKQPIRSSKPWYTKDMIYIGADHRGFQLKEKIKKHLQESGIEFEDMGNDHLNPHDDYVDFAHKVADEVRTHHDNKGIVLCGSGVGVDIVANKIDGIRCALVFDLPRAVQAREHENANMIALPADTINESQAIDMVEAFLDTPFSHEARHQRRLHKLEEIEEHHQ